jgi:predicted metalloendopeptidase
MTSKETKNIENDYVINPYTSRLIKKGSKTHKRLIAACLLDEDKPSTAQENIIMQASSPEEAKVLQSKMNKQMSPNKVITRRGNTVLKASRRAKQQEIVDKVSTYAIESVVENRDELMEQDMTDEQMDSYIRGLIQRKLVGQNTKPVQSKHRRQTVPPTRQPVREVEADYLDNYSEEDEY